MGRLEGKVAIVTGAGRGIGRGIALRYADEGVKVAAASRSGGTVDTLVKEIKGKGGTAIGITCDVGYEDQIRAVVDQTLAAFGRIDILVNAAHGFGTEASPTASPEPWPLESYRNEEWEYTFRTGATATLWAMKAVFPHMKEHGGRIINFGSQWGVEGWPGAAAYNAAKEAIRALTRTAAREWGKYQITVNCINPVIRTDGVAAVEKIMPEKVAEATARIPLGRWGDPYKDGGGLAVFLATEDGAFLTGATFPLDGGLTITA